MIHFLVRRDHRYTITDFTEHWGREIAPRVRIETYERVFRARTLRRGTWIFCDLDRLSPAELETAARIWRRLESARPGPRLLNHPLRAMQRYELLRSLHEQGVNDFDVYRLTEARRPRRYPVFLRRESDHRGPVTGLLDSPAELERAVAELGARGLHREGWLVVESCAEPDADGLYRKYSAFCVGGRVVPGPLLFGKEWLIKRRSPVGEAAEREELRHIESNEFAEPLGRIFRAARIDWGRADYGIVAGRPQIYEINTNPRILGSARPADPLGRRKKALLARGLVDALRALDLPGEGPERIWVREPSAVRRWLWNTRARLRSR